MLSVLGCGSEAEPALHGSTALVGLDAVATPARAEPVDVEPQVSEDWVGYGLGISPGRWRYLGELKMAGPGDRYVEPTYDPTAPSRPDRNPGAVVLFDDASKRVYEVNVPQEDLDRLAAEVAPLGFVETDLPPDAVVGEEDAEVAKSWSYGADARIPRNIADYGEDHYPYRVIGALKWDIPFGGSRDGHCTASFVHNPYGSRRYILTAAHCIWARQSGNYIDPDFYPRNDRCLDKYGQMVPGCDSAPYWEWDAKSWMLPGYFYDNCRGLDEHADACAAADIALLRVATTIGNYPGAFAWGYWTSDYLDDFYKNHRGYPNCDDPLDPQPPSPQVCLPHTLYGDGHFHMDDGHAIEPGSGYPALYLHSSDTSDGHSGGPTYFSASGQTWLFGVVRGGEACDPPTCPRPNSMRAITPWWFDQMVYRMSNWP